MGGAASRVRASTTFVARDLVRNRIAATLLLIIPTVFYVLIQFTTGERPIAFQLSALGEPWVTANERPVSLLFIGMAAVSGLSAFLAFVLVQRPAAADKRLVFEGYRPGELLIAKVCVMAAVAAVVAVYVSVLLLLFFRPSRLPGVFLGFLLTSVVYGVLGMVIGALVRRELEGILVILLLVNVDAGWLQSPVFYAHAHNQTLIRWLPGHHPGQVAMLSAFTEGGLTHELLASLGVLSGGLAAAAILYWLKVRVLR